MKNGDSALVEGIKTKRWREVDDLSSQQYALCEVAEKLSAQPTRMSARDWQPLRDLGFEDKAILEVAHIVSLFNYVT